MHKADGSVLIHSDGGSYKPLNWMNAPCTVTTEIPEEGEEMDGVTQVWQVQSDKTDDRLVIRIHEIISDVTEEFGIDPGLVKDGVETHLQELLAQQVAQVLGEGWELYVVNIPLLLVQSTCLFVIRRGYPLQSRLKGAEEWTALIN